MAARTPPAGNGFPFCPESGACQTGFMVFCSGGAAAIKVPVAAATRNAPPLVCEPPASETVKPAVRHRDDVGPPPQPAIERGMGLRHLFLLDDFAARLEG